MNSKYYRIAELAAKLWLAADGSSIVFLGTTSEPLNIGDEGLWKTFGKRNRSGELLFQSLDQLASEGIFDSEISFSRISQSQFPRLSEINANFLSGLITESGMSLSLRAEGTIGLSPVKMQVDLIQSGRKRVLDRAGTFVMRMEDNKVAECYQITDSQRQVLDVVETFNALSPIERSEKETGLRLVAQLQELTGGSGLDAYFAGQTVILPQKVKVDYLLNSSDLLSLVPAFDGVPQVLLAKEFIRFDSVQSVYDLEPESGKRIRVVVPPGLRPALEDIQRVRWVGGSVKTKVLTDVASAFSEGEHRQLVDFSGFSPRVKDVGNLPVPSKIWIRVRPRGWAEIGDVLAESPHNSQSDVAGEAAFELGLTLERTDGPTEIEFKNVDEFLELSSNVQAAVSRGEASVVFRDNTLLLSESLTQSIAEGAELLNQTAQKEIDLTSPAARNSRYLIIYTNDEVSEYAEGDSASCLPQSDVPLRVPKSLVDHFEKAGMRIPFSLKSHQLEGLHWLQRLFVNRVARKGALLADDMGLGKTVQILAFLAWCIEEGYLEGLGNDLPPYEPILIVAPPILLGNWEDEMKQFFRGKGGIFEPFVILHGAELRRFKSNQQRGREVDHGLVTLDVDRLSEHRVIITNYDTVANYQHSLRRVKWSVVVADEAQNIKEQNKRSYALKAMSALFRVVVTGTPVENRLLDLWNLVDFMQPGSVLGASKEFSKTYEKLSDLIDENQSPHSGSVSLRSLLRVNASDAFVLRRDKESTLRDLPSKTIEKIPCPISNSEREQHMKLVKELREESNPAEHLRLVHDLRKLYAHPQILLSANPVFDAKEAISQSSKLQKVLEILRKVRTRGEKALVFTDLQAVQRLLRHAFEHEFGIRYSVISGTQASDASASRSSRKEVLREFADKPGFNILILSPKVAGVGLTINEANHVIHYTRWWNPAKEAQATDRAYRIGQQKPVYVYYPLATDALKKLVTFDERLDALLDEKTKLARDFLDPQPNDDQLGAELIGKLRELK